jgi:hypothetical protein
MKIKPKTLLRIPCWYGGWFVWLVLPLGILLQSARTWHEKQNGKPAIMKIMPSAKRTMSMLS